MMTSMNAGMHLGSNSVVQMNHSTELPAGWVTITNKGSGGVPIELSIYVQMEEENSVELLHDIARAFTKLAFLTEQRQEEKQD